MIGEHKRGARKQYQLPTLLEKVMDGNNAELEDADLPAPIKILSP
jgi:hypothetical protein